MLQLAVTAHVEVANEVVLADSSLLHGPIRLRQPGKDCRIPISRMSVSGCASRCATTYWLHYTSQVCNGSLSTDGSARDLRPMSASLPRATKHWQRNKTTRCA